jgi:hypothetical protein
MAKSFTFEDAKLLIAGKYHDDFSIEPATWDDLIDGREPEEIWDLLEEVAEFYMRRSVNEAVKADREMILNKEHPEGSVSYEVMLVSMSNLPLPYPEEK